MRRVGWRCSCDSMVALPAATRRGMTVFAKNSDRPAWECQPLCRVEGREHPRGSVVRCTYIEIPQAERTYSVLGSRPYWCWGFEHGVNEHGVAIGNHTVFTRDPVADTGLLGMDLVRLGLERSRSAREAVETMAALLEEHGQGGSGYADKHWPYHNSFLIADPMEAYLWETSGRRWALKRVGEVASLSNHLSIGSDWDALSPDAIEHAVEEGWWDESSQGRFDFAAAYRDTSLVPEAISAGRHRRTCRLLGEGIGSWTVASMRQALRDHYGRVDPHEGVTPGDEEYFTVCMHAEPVGTTTASVVAELPPAGGGPLVYWASLGAACCGVFLPLFLDMPLPEVLTHGGEQEDPGSAWWRFRLLLERVEQDWKLHLPLARELLDPFEQAVEQQLEEVRRSEPARRQAFVATVVEQALVRVEELIRRLS